MFFVPESPRWLIRQGLETQAIESLEEVYLSEYVESMHKDIVKEARLINFETKINLRQRLAQLFTIYRKNLILGVWLSLSYLFMGGSIALAYGPLILIAAGNKFEELTFQQNQVLIMSWINFICCISIILGFLHIDDSGRRHIALRSLPLSTIAWIITAIGFYLGSYENIPYAGAYIALSGIIFFITTSNISMAMIPKIVCTEIFPLQLAGTALGIVTMFSFLALTFTNLLFVYALLHSPLALLLSILGLAAFCVVIWILIYKNMPETAKQPVYKIQELINGKNFWNRFKNQEVI